MSTLKKFLVWLLSKVKFNFTFSINKKKEVIENEEESIKIDFK